MSYFDEIRYFCRLPREFESKPTSRLRHVIWIAFGLSLFFSNSAPADDLPSDRDAQKPAATRLTFDGHIKHDPVFISGGKTLVYSSLEKFNQVCLMQVAFDPQQKPDKPTRFHPAANTSELMVSFANSEDRYAYVRNNGNLHFEIVIEDKRQGTSRKYNPGGGFAGVRNVSIAPDGSRVLFPFPNQNGPQQIHTLKADASKPLLLTNSNGYNVAPRFSHDGKQIVFASSRDGDFDIFSMNSDGSNPINLTRHQGLETHPCWSPDGKQIAFTRLHDGNYDIFVMRSDGTNVRQLTDSPEVDDYPCWHPNGKSIVWVAERNGKRDLYRLEISRLEISRLEISRLEISRLKVSD